MHVYEPGYPVRAQGSLPARSATLADYLRVKQRLGLTRTVVVQAGAYGTDNRCALAAMERLGADARGVAIVDPEAPNAEIGRLAKLGMRGIRYHMVRSPTLSWESLPGMAARVAAFGWHAQVQCEPREIAAREKMLAGLPCDLVIDHVGRMYPPLAPDDASWRALRRLVDAGRCWVKLSAPYHGSRSGPPRYEDIGVLAKELARAAPERMLWATNWPHPSVAEHPPDDAELLDLLAEWAPDETVRHRILVSNPARLYGFPTQEDI
jgi:D-galactarolactone isomerase